MTPPVPIASQPPVATRSLFAVSGTERVEIQGHLLNSGSLSRVLDEILGANGEYEIEKLALGKHTEDQSYARIAVSHPDSATLASIIGRIQQYGANPTQVGDAVTIPAPQDGVLPEGFYSSTNLETRVRVNGDWLAVENPEMDCGLVVTDGHVRTCPMCDIRAGDQVVVGSVGVKVVVAPRAVVQNDETVFEFMNSDVSTEKPQALLVRRVADGMRAARAQGQRILWVGGPAIVHTGAGPAFCALIRDGWCDVLFAGNALATHDIESAMFGTSLGIDLSRGSGVEHGHEHHLRAINRIRAAGSISQAVESGVLTTGIMHALVQSGAKFVLVGSVRDDGPLPDVITDVIAGQRAMRAALDGVGYAIMVATMLHAIATGNLMPASMPLVCVDINPATVTKLADRGSAQAVGIVTDIGLFLEQLAHELIPGYETVIASPSTS